MPSVVSAPPQGHYEIVYSTLAELSIADTRHFPEALVAVSEGYCEPAAAHQHDDPTLSVQAMTYETYPGMVAASHECPPQSRKPLPISRSSRSATTAPQLKVPTEGTFSSFSDDLRQRFSLVVVDGETAITTDKHRLSATLGLPIEHDAPLQLVDSIDSAKDAQERRTLSISRNHSKRHLQRTRTQKAQNRVSIVYKPQRGSAFDDARLRPISRRIEDIARSLRRVTWLERQTQLSPTLREDDDSFVLVPPAPVELVKIRPATQLRQRRVSQTNLTRIRSHGSRPHKLTKPDPSKLRRAADKPSHIPHKLSIDRAGCFGMKPDSPKSRTAAADRSDACAWPITTNTAMSTSVDPPDGAATFVCVEGNRSELARASAYLMLTGRPPPKRHLPPPKPRWSSPPPMQAAPRRLFRRGRPRFDQVDTLLDRARARWQ